MSKAMRWLASMCAVSLAYYGQLTYASFVRGPMLPFPLNNSLVVILSTIEVGLALYIVIERHAQRISEDVRREIASAAPPSGAVLSKFDESDATRDLQLAKLHDALAELRDASDANMAWVMRHFRGDDER